MKQHSIHRKAQAKRLLFVVAPGLSLGGRAKNRMVGWLTLLVAAIVFIAGTGQTDPTYATPVASTSINQLVWVRQEPPVINANNDPLHYEYPDPRFEGSFTEYTLNETNIAMETRFADYGYEYYHVTISNDFDRPPLVLNPPLRYKVTGSITHSGAPTEDAAGVGARSWYASDLASIEPLETLSYFPWSPDFDGTNSKDWMIEAPSIAQEGQTFGVVFGWWNCPPCNVTWTYRAEPANKVEQLGVEVVEPVVRFQGEEVQPGEVFFPETCALSDARAGDGCSHSMELFEEAQLHLACFNAGNDRLIAKINHLSRLLDLSPDEMMLVYYLALRNLENNCGFTRASEEYQLDLVLEQGGMLLDGVITGQIINVHTKLGTATAADPGVFAAGYNPGTQAAIFHAYSTPLKLEPKAGPSLVLQPAHQVELTATGFGPVSDLPHIFLPVQIK